MLRGFFSVSFSEHQSIRRLFDRLVMLRGQNDSGGMRSDVTEIMKQQFEVYQKVVQILCERTGIRGLSLEKILNGEHNEY